MCTRVLYVSKDGNYVLTGRNMDWYVRYPTTLWKFPKGLKRSGLTQVNPAHWVSKYGSVALVQTTYGQSATTDGMNEKGLVCNLLYLTETEYGTRDPAKEGVASSIYLQYLLDNFASVEEAVTLLKQDKIQIVPVPIPNSEHPPTMHISLSDSNGDSAIIEFLAGEVVIHHSKEYKVMTNSPIFEKQLALTEYWNNVGGHHFLPGTRNSPDRFVRAAFYSQRLPEPQNYREAVAGLMSVMRNVSSPFGDPDPEKPNISSTMWRAIADHKNLVYFYESTISYGALWVDFKKLNFSSEAPTEMLEADTSLLGDVTEKFRSSPPLEFAKP